jgi:hypothetical protein
MIGRRNFSHGLKFTLIVFKSQRSIWNSTAAGDFFLEIGQYSMFRENWVLEFSLD